MKKLSIIIVNWNGEELMKVCLDSIYKFIGEPSFEVIVVDNGSVDNSVNLISERFPLVKLIKNHKNVGFAAAVNKAIEIAQGEYILLLNNDTELLDNAFLPMIEFMDKNPKIGVMGCKLKNRNGEVENSCDSFPTFASRIIGKICERSNFLRKLSISMRYWNYDTLREVDVVSGACLLTKRSIIQKVGKLDEKFFMYHEDTDFCYRVKRNGFKIYFFPFSSIIHERSRSSVQKTGRQKIIHRKTQYIFVRKHYGILEELVYKIYFYIVGTLFIFYYKLKHNEVETKNWEEVKKIYENTDY